MPDKPFSEIELKFLRLLADRWVTGLHPLSSRTIMREIGLFDDQHFLPLATAMKERGLVYFVMWHAGGPSFLGPTSRAYDVYQTMRERDQL